MSPTPETRWRPYRPYSYPNALDGMGTIAAPLLASVSIALIAVVLASASEFRLLNGVLLLLVIAAAAFVATVECSYVARQYVVTPSQLEEWWPDFASRLTSLRREQRYYKDRFKLWSNRARYAYDVGLVALGLGVIALLVPASHIAFFRLVAIILAAVAVVAEIAWIINTRTRQPEATLPEVGPESGPSAASPSAASESPYSEHQS
jgi:hypothetical protein